LRLRVAVNSLDDSISFEAIARAGGEQAGQVRGPVNTEVFLPISKPKLWSPDDPVLYDLEVRLTEAGHEQDRVSSYFGLRKIGLLQDKHGFTCIGLNGQPLFELGALDQGFWPDGIYTAPTDEALRSDIAFLKSAGFNLARKHVKIEPDRWYYWCDKLGLLVWQDMPSGNNATPAAQRGFEAELLHMVNDLYNHPSVIVWVLFNEGWGQYDTQRLTQRLKTLDPSRLVDDASGWTDMRTGDIVDMHNYPGPNAPSPEPRRAAVTGECGGLGLVVDGHSWSSTRRWSYRMETNCVALERAYSSLIREIYNLHEARGLSAAIYTQTADVETECNGLLSYDRAVAKLDAALLARINRTIQYPALGQVILADAMHGPATWKYAFQEPGTNWFTAGYDDSGWKEGPAGFGTEQTPGAVVKTEWKTADIWLRRRFTLGAENLRDVKLEVHHDEDAEIYFNGVLAANLPGFITAYDQFDLLPAALESLKPGPNIVAVHCHQTTGGQYIDVGLIIPTKKDETDGATP
jgi:beta-galactosidase/beta-glucuronidase